MGVSIDSGGGGGKRPVNAELNLVPFIDLLVCCICFLLITAVWTQMALVKANQRGPGTVNPDTEEKPPEPPLKISVLVGDDGYTITHGVERETIEKKGAFYDTTALGKMLKTLIQGAEKLDFKIEVEDDIHYEFVVQAMDVALQQDIKNIRLAHAGTKL